jgi:hypothetical protein
VAPSEPSDARTVPDGDAERRPAGPTPADVPRRAQATAEALAALSAECGRLALAFESVVALTRQFLAAHARHLDAASDGLGQSATGRALSAAADDCDLFAAGISRVADAAGQRTPLGGAPWRNIGDASSGPAS